MGEKELGKRDIRNNEMRERERYYGWLWVGVAICGETKTESQCSGRGKKQNN